MKLNVALSLRLEVQDLKFKFHHGFYAREGVVQQQILLIT